MTNTMTPAQQAAIELADSRKDYYVSLPGRTPIEGPLSERLARQLVEDARVAGRKPLLLKVVEDYGR